MDLPHLLLHGLGWSIPALGLSALTILFWALRRPAPAPRLGWWGGCLVLVAIALATQAITLWGLRWPDGSMASYAVLILVLAAFRVALTRPIHA